MSILKTPSTKLDFQTLEFYFMYVMTSLALLEWLLTFSMHVVIILKVSFQTYLLIACSYLSREQDCHYDDKTVFPKKL